MNARNLLTLLVATLISANAIADGSDEELLAREKTLSQMKFTSQKLKFQADMAKSFKDMSDSGFIVDPQGVPRGVGDMEKLAEDVRRGAGASKSPSPGGASGDPFGAVPGFGGSGGDFFSGAPLTSPRPQMVSPPQVDASESSGKPTEPVKPLPPILRLTELRANAAVFFTNDGFQEVSVGQKINDLKLTKINVDSVVLKGKQGNKILRIDWTKPVRYQGN